MRYLIIPLTLIGIVLGLVVLEQASNGAPVASYERELTITQPISITDPQWEFLKKDFPTAEAQEWDFSALKYDLSDDGVPETFVYVSGGGACGAHNCPVVGYRLSKGEQIKILSLSGPPSFSVLKTVHNGLHDLRFGDSKYVWQYDKSEYK